MNPLADRVDGAAPAGRDVAGCTVITKRYLPYARVLARSFAEHNRGANGGGADAPTFYCFLADRVEGCFDPSAEPFCVVQLDEFVEAPLIREMSFRYTAFELCNALKAWAHQYLLRRTNHAAWAYFDADILITDSLDGVWAALNGRNGLMLTPHMLAAPPAALGGTLELNVVRFGIHNGGFVCVRRSDEAEAFVAWFIDRMRRFCFQRDGLTCDQKWIDLLPVYFGAQVYRHPGANVAYWNLHERRLAASADGSVTAGGAPMMFFHFSGFTPERPGDVSRYAEIDTAAFAPVWQALARGYVDALQREGLPACMGWGYSFGRFSDGRAISTPMRGLYDIELAAGRISAEDNPFEQGAFFRRRLTSTRLSGIGGSLSRVKDAFLRRVGHRRS